MSWHFNPKTGIWDKYADNPYQANQEVNRINAIIASGGSVGGASPEYGQTLITLAMIPVASHIAATSILGGLGARTAIGAAAGGTAAGAGLTTAGAIGGASLIGLATTGAKIGFDIYLLNWLKDNWWIPAILIGGYIGIKLIK